MKREAFKTVGNPLLMGGPVLFSRAGDGAVAPPPVNTITPSLIISEPNLLYGAGLWENTTSVTARLFVDGVDTIEATSSMPIQAAWRGKPCQIKETATGPGGSAEALSSTVTPALTLDQQVLNILAGTPGFRIDPRNLSTMFQDSAGTIPVTASGQPVGRINTQGGTTVNNFNQPTVAAQPTLANLNALLGDGVDDLLGGPTPWVFVNMPALFLCFEAELVAYPPANRGMYGFSNNQTIFVQLNVNEVGAISVSMINALGPPASANGVMLVGQKRVVTLICDWTTEGRYEVFVDGVVVTSVVRGPTTAPAHSNINRHRLMSNIANIIAPVNAKVGRLVLSDQLMTPTERATIEAWVGEN